MLPRVYVHPTIIMVGAALTLISCKPAPGSVSTLSVIDGGEVTSPEQAPGTYKIQSYKGDELVGNASGVAVGQDTILTSGHVVANDPAMGIDRVEIRDYQDNVVRSFSPTEEGVTPLVNPDFFEQGPQADIGAFVFDEPIPQDRLTQGVVSVGDAQSTEGKPVYLVGNGVQDYSALDYTNPEARTPDVDSGTLRWGTNQIAQTDDRGFYINGVGFDTPDVTGQSVSGPGDSGGGAFIVNEDGSRQFVGLMQGGGLFDPANPDPQSRYFDYQSNPSKIAEQPNSAYSYIVDVTKQGEFLDQVQLHGGEVNGRGFESGPIARNPSYVYQPIDVAAQAPPPDSLR